MPRATVRRRLATVFFIGDAVIQMPAGVWAGSIAADPTTHSLWVGNSGFERPQG